MKKLFVSIFFLGRLTPFRAYGQSGGTLAGVLSRQGLASAKLERRYGNHLFVPVSINNRHGGLLIATASIHSVSLWTGPTRASAVCLAAVGNVTAPAK